MCGWRLPRLPLLQGTDLVGTLVLVVLQALIGSGCGVHSGFVRGERSLPSGVVAPSQAINRAAKAIIDDFGWKKYELFTWPDEKNQLHVSVSVEGRNLYVTSQFYKHKQTDEVLVAAEAFGDYTRAEVERAVELFLRELERSAGWPKEGSSGLGGETVARGGPQTPTNKEQPQGDTGLEARLKELQDLLKKGLITKEEHDQQRARLLGGGGK